MQRLTEDRQIDRLVGQGDLLDVTELVAQIVEPVAGGEVGELLVVAVALGDRLLEDRRVGGDAHDVLLVEQGSLYPALYRLEDQGWIESEWGFSDNNRKAKFYKLTSAGRKQLIEERSNWERLSAAINTVLKTT